MTLSVTASASRTAWMRFERAVAQVFSQGCNPLAHLGAIACLLFATLLVSGIYLYAVFDTSVDGAWKSIDSLSREQPFPGGWLRSLHRYAADAFVLVTLLHLLREWMLGRYTRFRRVTWLTGIPLLLFLYISGIGGFWLNWDRLGQYSALASAELIDALPLIAAPMTRNFVTVGAVSDRLFTLLIFIHIGVALLLLFGLWFHLQRIHLPQVLPARPLSLGLGLTLALLAAAVPVTSQAPADLASVPTRLDFDWIVLHLHPLAEATSPALVWALIAGLVLLLIVLPLRGGSPGQPVAMVDPDNCNGCRRCVDDCPYEAITLEPHPNGRIGRQLAVVSVDRCASCGICAGACPSATPFRSTEMLLSGIDMPQQTVDALRSKLHDVLVKSPGERKIIVFGCDHGADVAALADRDVVHFSLLCIGLLPPSFVEYALRAGALGVVVSGCVGNSCEFRLGSRWTAERLAGTREPHLRATVPVERYRAVFANDGDEPALAAAIASFRASVRQWTTP
jgi:ferredoxin/coenzyme F420-reducing hydrogenase delta subunit